MCLNDDVGERRVGILRTTEGDFNSVPLFPFGFVMSEIWGLGRDITSALSLSLSPPSWYGVCAVLDMIDMAACMHVLKVEEQRFSREYASQGSFHIDFFLGYVLTA